MSSTIAVEALRVGMFIHLDGGWLSHPFPMSNFRLGNPEQIAALRSLGLQRVRWSPERSDAASADAAPASDSAFGARPAAADDCALEAAAAAAALPELSEAEAALLRHRQALRAQRDTQRQCEQQFAEASQAWRKAGDAIATHPELAREAVDSLAGAMIDKLMLAGEVGIRLVPGDTSDCAAAHALNVSVVSMLIGRSLGLGRAELHELSLGALTHDIGKIGLPERARHPEPGCSTAQTEAYREHVARGVASGRRMQLADGVLSVIAQHHEHCDASGFPQRLGGERIALAARIVAIVNRYDNLCNPAGRAPALSPHEAVATLFAHNRAHYDGGVLIAFIRMMGVYPAGSLVQLTDGRYGMVVASNTSRPLKPRVLVHEAHVPGADALLLNLEHTPDLGIRRSLSAAKVPVAALQYLDPRPRVSYFFEPLAEPATSLAQPA